MSRNDDLAQDLESTVDEGEFLDFDKSGEIEQKATKEPSVGGTEDLVAVLTEAIGTAVKNIINELKPPKPPPEPKPPAKPIDSRF